jgi:hypothetical protein
MRRAVNCYWLSVIGAALLVGYTETAAAAPNAPSNLVAKPVSSTQIRLTWKDNSPRESGFKIERSVNGTSFAQITTVGRNIISFTSGSLTASTKYYYRVRAYNSAGNSAYSNIAYATTVSPTPTPTPSPSPTITLEWDPAQDATGYRLYSGSSSGAYSKSLPVDNATSVQLQPPAETTYFAVTAYNATGESPKSNEVRWP